MKMKMKQSGFILGVILLLVMSCSTIFAQNIVDNMDIVNSDIRDVFRSLGEMGGYNVLMDKTVQGNVTMKVSRNLTIKEVIELLAQTYGYSFRWVNNNTTVIVGDAKTFVGFESRYAKVYKLNYAKAEEAVAALKVVVKEEQIGVDKRTNQLTILGNVIEHENIQEIIAIMDRVVPQVNIECRVEEITKNASKSLGFDPIYVFSREDSEGNARQAGAFVYSTSGFNHFEMMLKLDALEEEGMARLLANPNVSTTDNQQGTIFIGDKYPVVTKNTGDDGVTYEIDYIDVGTRLTFTPRINNDKVVTVEVKAEVSTITAWRTAGENDVPLIRTREAHAVVRLNDGETFVLSGLKSKNFTEKTSGVPYLRKIPLVGLLFNKKTVQPNEETDICIFITPKIIRGNEPAPEIEKEIQVKPSAAAPASAPAQAKQQQPIHVTIEEQVKPVSVVEPAPAVVQEATAGPAAPVVAVEPAVAEEEPVVSLVDTDVAGITAVEEGQQSEATREVSYVVKKGETLNTIARKFGVQVDAIMQQNGLTANQIIREGQILTIPIPANHIYAVQPKETLWRISKRYGTTVDFLMEINGITDVTQVAVGQQIIISAPVDKIADSSY